MEKKDLVVWITGAGSGIGRAAAMEFAREGFKTIASSRREDLLKSLKAELSAENPPLYTLPCDITLPSLVEETLGRINSLLGDVDCLINNAGVTSFKPAEENSLDEIKEIIETNLVGSIYTIKSVLPGMIKRKGGTIINVISTAALEVLPNSSVYSASKAGLKAYSDVLREEVRKYNIRIIDIFPGPTRTPMWPEEMLKEHGSKMMEPREIARVMVSAYKENNTLVTEKIVMKPIGGSI
ncbi:MAG: SDR family NAD(P)-dependent oxidoreductase [Acidobacteriota bacterium]